MDKPRMHVESSVVSCSTARSSRDFLVLSHQEITRMWWEQHLHTCEPCVSGPVICTPEELLDEDIIPDLIS
jgi:hypothetical protein